ncbi:MAG: SpoIIE family protein phosphatase [Planctomycetes bacterium]|nr:SpoIIE family protein phosphatase [Planctomycetota bacterium]
MKLWLKFAISMTLSLAAVMSLAGYMLYSNGSQVAERAQDAVMVQSVKLSGQFADLRSEIQRLTAERDVLAEAEQQFAKGGRMDPGVLVVRDAIRALREERVLALTKAETELEAFWKKGVDEIAYPDGNTFRYPVTFGKDESLGWLYRYLGKDEKQYELLVPADVNMAEEGLLRVIVWSTLLVVLVGAGVASFVASTVSRPISQLVHDIQQIAKGMLNHRARGGESGEVGQLSIAINKMAKGLAEARETEVELSIREREVALAGEVRESLLPDRPPKVEGYDLASLHLASGDLGGDFHDFLVLPDGRVGLLVCDVSGKGVPGAMVGAMARAYLRSELARGGDVRVALRTVNRDIARDIRRGMFVTALYVLVDPKTNSAWIACAGHKVPLLRVVSSDGKLRTIQPEGIALGFDKGPVFDRRLEVGELVLAPGDRLLLCNSGTLAVTNGNGAEIGEKAVYTAVQKHAAQSSEDCLERLKTVLEAHADGNAFAKDVSVVTIART